MHVFVTTQTNKNKQKKSNSKFTEQNLSKICPSDHADKICGQPLIEKRLSARKPNANKLVNVADRTKKDTEIKTELHPIHLYLSEWLAKAGGQFGRN